MTEPFKTGLYSAIAADRFGTFVWADADGREVEITSTGPLSGYKFPDARVVSESLTGFVRVGRPDRSGAPQPGPSPDTLLSEPTWPSDPVGPIAFHDQEESYGGPRR